MQNSRCNRDGYEGLSMIIKRQFQRYPYTVLKPLPRRPDSPMPADVLDVLRVPHSPMFVPQTVAEMANDLKLIGRW